MPERIDPATRHPGAALVVHLFEALGQFEPDLIQERTRAGLAAATARGRKGGRKPVIVADKLERTRAMVARGLSVRQAEIRLEVGKTALYGIVKLKSMRSVRLSPSMLEMLGRSKARTAVVKYGAVLNFWHQMSDADHQTFDEEARANPP